MEIAASFIFGLVILCLAGGFVEILIDKGRRNYEKILSEVMSEEWKEALKFPNELRRATKWLGRLERLFYFLVLWNENGFMAIGAWLGFKVASKWEAWKNMIKTPESNSEIDNDCFVQWRYRNIHGTATLQRWLIGNLSNLLAGLVAYGGACTLQKLISFLKNITPIQ